MGEGEREERREKGEDAVSLSILFTWQDMDGGARKCSEDSGRSGNNATRDSKEENEGTGAGGKEKKSSKGERKKKGRMSEEDDADDDEEERKTDVSHTVSSTWFGN